ncbi:MULTISPECIES: MFS transporter [unclassified Bradyrhizobium]|uniref:MFS transporter n=1 Tax=unclassified Bradyrhizobium TaxID=2631580 RepID=UPI0028EC560A|nr:MULTISPECIES: MFS transporter [unclassified Bradyrhizobium]
MAGTKATRQASISQIAIFMAIVVATVGQTFVFSVLPPIGRKIGIADVLIALISAGSALFYTIGAPVLGGLTERLGRKPFILAGLISGVVANGLFGLVVQLSFDGSIATNTTYAGLVFLRLALSVSWAGMFPAAQALIADTTQPERRTAAFALIGAAFSLGMICGPAIGAALSVFGLVAPFYCAAALHLVPLALTLVGVSETAPNRSSTPGRRYEPPRNGVSARPIRTFLVIAVFYASCSSLVQQLMGFRLQDVFFLTEEQTARWTGVLLVVMASAMLSAQFITRAWMKRTRKAIEATLWMLVAGGAVGALAVTVLATWPASSLWLQSAAMAALGLGLGLLIPSVGAAISLIAGEGAQGRAAGLFSSAQGIGFVIGPALGTVMYEWSHTGPFWMASALLVTISAIAWRTVMNAPNVEMRPVS